MRRKFIALLVFVVLLSAALPVLAVRFGQPDNGEHPYVGLVVFFDNGVPAWRCTGTMISARVLLTAGHCSDSQSGREARVYFYETAAEIVAAGYPYSGGYHGIAYSSPWWSGGISLPNSGDVGVVILDSAPNVGTAPLAPAGTLDSLSTQRGRQNTDFQVVGYGLQQVRPAAPNSANRLKANVQLVNLRSQLTDGYNLHTTNNPGQGTGPGGTCFGDSGGAIFYNGQVVAVNSFVLNSNCAGASFGYRTDRQEVIDWVYGYVNANP
jgi:secreted trypsin-like serine protease